MIFNLIENNMNWVVFSTSYKDFPYILTKKDIRANTSSNKRFGKIGGGKVIAQTSARPLTVGDNPNGVQLIRYFAKPPGR